MRRMAVVVALGSLLAAGGCGGGGSDAAQVADVVNEYIDAFVDGDSEAVCDALTTEARAEIAESGGVLGDGGCEGVIEAAVGLIDDSDLDSLRDLKVTESDVTIDGDTATVEGATLPGEEDTAQLVKKDGEWYITPDS